jgi:putative sigma-54 modulation protein
MATEVTARHMNTAQDVQNHARIRAEGLVAEFPRIEHVHVILDIEKHRQIAEMVVQAKRHLRVEAREESDNMRASIDMVTEKVEKQLRRQVEKVHEHRQPRTAEDGEAKV